MEQTNRNSIRFAGAEDVNQSFQLSSFLNRFFAFLIDSSLIFISFISIYKLPVSFVVAKIRQATGMDLRLVFILSHLGLLVVISILYYSIMEISKFQGSLGKILLDSRVVNKDGQRITIGQAILRNMIKILSMGFGGLGFLSALFTSKKQSLHDLIARTYVIKSNGSIDKTL